MFDLFYPYDWLSSQIVKGLGVSLESPLGESLHFFFYDVPKVLTLLLVISFVISLIQGFLQPERVRTFLEKQQTWLGNGLAAALGAVTPFCSCSAVPLFIGFLKAGVPLGITFSYLIAAPMVDAVAIALLWGLFGLSATLIYVGFGVGLAILAGYGIGRLNLENEVAPFIVQLRQATSEPVTDLALPVLTRRQRYQEAWRQTREILQTVWLYVVLGIAIGAAIHGYVPTEWIARWAGPENPIAVLVAVIAGVPLYTNIAGVLPIAAALVSKGMPLGTVLAFTMAVTALSLPQMIILKQVLRPKLLATFVGITTVGIIGVGYLFNAVLGLV